MKLKSTITLHLKRMQFFIEILVDSIQTWHQGNFTIFGGSDLGFMTGTCPDIPDIYITGDV